MRYTVTKQRIYVLGKIWMPCVTASLVKDLSEYDLANIPDPANRDDVERWVMLHSGDFSAIEDFSADFDLPDGRHVIHEWALPDSEMKYSDTLGGDES